MIFKWTITVIAYLLGFIFIFASLTKIFYFSDFVTSVNAYKIFPISTVKIMCYILILIEFSAGVIIFIKKYRIIGSILISILLIIFITFTGVGLAKDLKINCGCFPVFRNRIISFNMLVEDLLLFILALSVTIENYLSRIVGSN